MTHSATGHPVFACARLLPALLAAVWLAQPPEALAQARKSAAGITENIPLLTMADWSALCRAGGREAQACLIRLSTHAGRTVDSFAIAPAPSADTVMARSGIFFNPEVRKLIAQVREDSGQRLIVRLRSGAECYAFSAHGTLLASLEEERDGFDGFVRYLLDTPQATAGRIDSANLNGRPVRRFAYPPHRLEGLYYDDAPRNAGLWLACRGEGAAPALGQWFGMALGSARFYY